MLRTILAASTMTTLGALPPFLLTAQVVYVSADLDFGAAQLGLAASMFFGAAALASFATGLLAERLGSRVSTAVAATMSVISCLGIGTVTRTYAQLLCFIVVAGFANAAMQTTANLTLARAVPAGRQGLAFGLKQSAIPVAILLGGLAVPTLGSALGWRATFVAAAVAAVAVGLAGVARAPVTGRAARRTDEARDLPPTHALVVTSVAMALASAAVNAMGAFLPAWAFESGLHPGEAGYLLAAASATSVVGRIASGLAADRRGGHNIPVVSAQMAVGAVGMLLISLGSPLPLALGALLGFAIGWSWPGLLMFAVVRIARDSPGVASSAVQTGAFAGGALGPLLFGLLVASRGYPAAWPAAMASLLVGAALLLVARRMFVRDIDRRPPVRPFANGRAKSTRS